MSLICDVEGCMDFAEVSYCGECAKQLMLPTVYNGADGDFPEGKKTVLFQFKKGTYLGWCDEKCWNIRTDISYLTIAGLKDDVFWIELPNLAARYDFETHEKYPKMG